MKRKDKIIKSRQLIEKETKYLLIYFIHKIIIIC